LAISEKALGSNHPNTAGSLKSLAFIPVGQGDFAAARRPIERLLAISEKTLGPRAILDTVMWWRPTDEAENRAN
jgi:hypothetical protein